MRCCVVVVVYAGKTVWWLKFGDGYISRYDGCCGW